MATHGDPQMVIGPGLAENGVNSGPLGYTKERSAWGSYSVLAMKRTLFNAAFPTT